jgi:small subunit ribosomal protein S17
MAHTEVGTVVSTKMQNTVVVKVQRKIKHPLYKKQVTKSNKFLVSDELGVKNGQKVKFIETKPISKNVHFKIVEVIS